MKNVKATSAFLHGVCVVAVEFLNVHSIIMYNTDSSYVYSAVKATVEVH